MPFDETSLALPPTARVQPSTVAEFSWLTCCAKPKPRAYGLSPALEAETLAFWGDGDQMLAEVLVVAQQVGCLTGWDIEPMLALRDAEIDATAEMDLESEKEDERVLIVERVARLAADADLRERYSRILQKIWDEIEPAWRESGRSTVERAVQRTCASLEHGQSPLEFIPEHHIARREPWLALTERSLRDGTLLLTPCFTGGEPGGGIVALPGVLSIAVGTGVTTDMARNRATAERVAHDLKLLSDPTRVLILTELEREPGTVGQIAQRVGVAQPTASVHVRQLREAGLLTATRDGASSSYRVERSRLREALRSAHEALLPELTPTGS